MRIRADLSETIALQTHELPWEPSPAPGIERRYLSRDEEKGLATSYCPLRSGCLISCPYAFDWRRNPRPRRHLRR